MTKTITRTAKIGASTRHSVLPEGAAELLVRDKDLTGFALRIRPGSARYIVAGLVAGTSIRRTITIGDAASMTATEARERAMTIRNRLRAGEDLVRAKPILPDLPTFGDVANEFHARWASGALGRKAPRPASVVSGVKDLKRALAAFSSTRIDEIDPAAVRRFRAKLLAEDVSPAVKRRAFGALSQVMRYAHEIGHIAENPVTGFTLPTTSPPRDRYLTQDELAAVWTACAALGRPGEAIRFLIAMPVRLSVAQSLEWQHVDRDAATITIPASMRGNKAGETFQLPLSGIATEIIDRQPTRDGLIFRGRQGGPISLGSDVKDRLDALSGVSDWRLHDLRRTVVTLLADADHEIDVDAADRWLQHKRSGMKSVYQRAHRLGAMRKIADAWDRVLRGVLGLEANGNIVEVAFR